MPTISIIYPHQEGATFDYDYYANSHLAKARASAPGLKSMTALRGLPGPDGTPPPYFAIVLMEFGSMEDFMGAMSNPDAGKMQQDVVNFTTVQPIVQINEAIAL